MAAAVATTQTDAQVAELCRQAFEAEHHSRFQEAHDTHGKAIVALNKLADDAKFLDRERKRIARKQVKFHTGRRELMQQIISGQKKGLDVVLPSSISARQSLGTMINGRPCLSLDELLLSKALKPYYDQAQSVLPQGTVANSKNVLTTFLAAVKANPALITPEIQHLLPPNPDGTPCTQIPFYTPTLDKTVPDTIFHIYMSSENVFTSGRWFYFKVKDSSERATLYVMQALKRRRFQVNQTYFSRATEFTSPCVQTIVNPVQSTGSRLDGGIGRQMTHITTSPLPVVDKPDRTKHIKWEPRRFQWGGRQWVWKSKSTQETILCEVKREWGQPGSKTGKMLDECFEEVVHFKTKIALSKVAVVTFKYGMAGDFLWREMVLASYLAYVMVLAFGHD